MNAPSVVLVEPVRLVLCGSCARARGVTHSEGWRQHATLVASGLCDDCGAAFCMCSGMRPWTSPGAPRRPSSRCVVTVSRGLECPVTSAAASAVVAGLFVYERVSA